MSEPITESKYPIRLVWVFEYILYFLFVIPVLVIYWLYYFPYSQFLHSTGKISDERYILIPIILILYPLYKVISKVSWAYLKRKNFHFSLEDQYLRVRQGVLSKEQRNLPYSAIQNIILSRSLFEKIFGLATLQIENAVKPGFYSQRDSQKVSAVGSYDNKLVIPGLSKSDAENLKIDILRKAKGVIQVDSNSGL